METPLSPGEEIRILADSLFDGHISQEQSERLDSLIFSDAAFLQIYLERMTFHAEVLKNASGRTPGQAISAAMHEFSQSVLIQQRRDSVHRAWIIASMVAATLLVVPGVLYLTGAFQATSVGIVSGLSANINGQGDRIRLGQTVRIGDILTIPEGIVSLQLPHALVDVLGPATIRLENSQKLFVSTGKVYAKVLSPGTRLVIVTPDVEVVDLGTEFLVEHDAAKGTAVSVRQGRVQASLLDWRGQPANVLELTDERSAEFRTGNQSVKETVFRRENFQPVDRSRGGIRSIDGSLRTVTQVPGDLRSLQTQTPNHMLVIPERQQVVLEHDLLVQGMEGPVRFPAGTTLSSYLIHYDPPVGITAAPRGGVKFFDAVGTVIVGSSGLELTDEVFASPGTQFERAKFREFELDEDEIRISKDRQTVSFYCGVNPGEHLDEARVLVVSAAESQGRITKSD